MQAKLYFRNYSSATSECFYLQSPTYQLFSFCLVCLPEESNYENATQLGRSQRMYENSTRL